MGGTIESRRIQKLDFGRGQLVENPISRSPIRLERLLRSEFARAAIFFCLWGMIVDRAGTASAEHPQDSPGAAVADPSASQVESLAMLIQIVDQLETYVRTRDLASIHNEDIILGFALGELLARADLVVPDCRTLQDGPYMVRYAGKRPASRSRFEPAGAVRIRASQCDEGAEDGEDPFLRANLGGGPKARGDFHMSDASRRDRVGNGPLSQMRHDTRPSGEAPAGRPRYFDAFPRGTARLRTHVGTVDRG